MQNNITAIISRIILSNKKNLATFLENFLVDNNEIFITFGFYDTDKDTLIKEVSSLKNTIIENIAKTYPDHKVYITFSNLVKNKNSKQNYQNTFSKKKFSNIKNIVAIASGKGGVGKSTFTVNLAYLLKSQGLKVGILDGDIYGPSIAFMMGNNTTEESENIDGNNIPISKIDGIKYNSIASFLSDENSAVVLKAPMAIKVFNQMFDSSSWGELDVLLIDLPPGTGDIHINLCLKFEITGVIVICTPQQLALIDAIKSINMYKQVNTNILGIVENMSSFECPSCGSISNIFDNNKVIQVSKEHGIDFLGNIPISMKLRVLSDNSSNLVKSQDTSIATQAFVEIAKKIALKLQK